MAKNKQNKAKEMAFDLKNKQQKVHHNAGGLVLMTEIDKRINRIKTNYGVYKNTSNDIVKDLAYLRDNQDKLLEEKGKTFAQFIEETFGISKATFYNRLQVHDLCIKYDHPHLYKEADYSTLLEASRIKDPKIQKKVVKEISNNPDIKRDYVLEVKKSINDDITKIESEGSDLYDTGEVSNNEDDDHSNIIDAEYETVESNQDNLQQDNSFDMDTTDFIKEEEEVLFKTIEKVLDVAGSKEGTEGDYKVMVTLELNNSATDHLWNVYNKLNRKLLSVA